MCLFLECPLIVPVEIKEIGTLELCAFNTHDETMPGCFSVSTWLEEVGINDN